MTLEEFTEKKSTRVYIRLLLVSRHDFFITKLVHVLARNSRDRIPRVDVTGSEQTLCKDVVKLRLRPGLQKTLRAASV